MRFFAVTVIGLFLSLTACSNSQKASDKSEEKSSIQAPAPVIKQTGAAADSTKPVVGANKIECSVKGDARFLEVRPAGNGCELGYNKGGRDGVVASSASNGLAYCEAAREKIAARLKGSGFSCK